MIKGEFIKSLKNYTLNEEQHLSLWNEVEKNYSKSNRHYHNLSHLNFLLNELGVHKNKFICWDTIVFAIIYHDVIYNSLKSNNEEKSAELAIRRLNSFSFPEKFSATCNKMILATKKHEPADHETNLFTDADLSILGSDPVTYLEYSKQIRREYSIYPDLVYKPGRKKALAHFLAMVRIYKTDEFGEKYEDNARKNIQAELSLLN